MNHLKSLREVRGLSQQQLGDLLGVSQSTVARYENGIIELSLPMALRIISVLDCTMSQLTGQDIA